LTRVYDDQSSQSMRESVDLTPLPGPSGLAEASDEIDRNSEVTMNFPASTQVSTALEPLQVCPPGSNTRLWYT
jgi:hypothetical protein